MADIAFKNFDELRTEFDAKLVEYGSQITNRQGGGAYDLVIRVFSLMLSDAYTVLEKSLQQGFVSTASGDFLDLHAIVVGLTRQPATKAKKDFILKRTSTTGVLQVNIADIIKTPILPNRGQLRWFTIESEDPLLAGFAGQFENGQSKLTLTLEADEAGSVYNNMEELLERSGEKIEMEIESGLFGVDDGVTSTGEDLLAGTDRETDEELRERIVGRWAEVALGATRLSYINFAKNSSPRIDDVNAYKGTNATDVKIVLSGHAGNRNLSNAIGIKVYPDDNFDTLYTDDGLVTGTVKPLGVTVHEYIRERAPLTDFIILLNVVEVPTNIDVDITVSEGFVVADVISLVEDRLTALFILDTTIDDVTALEVGEKLMFSEITRILNDTEGVGDFYINDPTQAGVAPNNNEALSVGVITVGEL